MAKRSFRIISFFLSILSFFTLSVSAFALTWDGSSAGGGGGGTPAGPNGYAIRYTDENDLVGYRFSVVDKSGANKVSKSIDVFLNNFFGDYDYNYVYKFSTKYNKRQLIGNQNIGFSTSLGQVNCYKEASMGFATILPFPSGMETWQNNTTNLNKVLAMLGIGSISKLKNGDKILVEPLWSVRLESVFHALTVTEIAIYGKHILGASSDGGASYTSDSWGFISEFTNKFFPNALFTPNGQGLWTGVSAASSRLTFYDIINKGYGVGIAYNETKNDYSPTLSVLKCEAWPGALGQRNNNLFGTSQGSIFENWIYENDYPKAGDTIWYSVNFPAEKENIYVQQKVWIEKRSTSTRKIMSNSGTWYDVLIDPKTVENDKPNYIVKARVDWIDSNGNVLKYGTEKSFYIPIKPVIINEKVSAVNQSGNVQASNGINGSNGVMYFGQTVSFNYLFSSLSDWTSYNNIAGTAFRWNGTSWTEIKGGGKDLSIEKSAISKSSAVNKFSDIKDYELPLPVNENDNSYTLKFILESEWFSDPSHTHGSNTFYIPIVKSDVEILDIKLVDEEGNYADKNDLIAGEKLTVRYVYKNNTNCTVFVKGYNYDGSQIPGVYSINSNGRIEVEGTEITVPNERSLSIWGGVYLDTVEKGNTEYEIDGTNNAKEFECKVHIPLYLEAIEPNAPYREKTEVISSYHIINPGAINVIPDSNIIVRLKVYSSDNRSVPLHTLSKSVVVPSGKSNLIYFKWSVPEGLERDNVTLVADIFDGAKHYSEVSVERETIPYELHNTPDTFYEDKAPDGFVSPKSYTLVSKASNWNEYIYEDGQFINIRYGLSVLNTAQNDVYPAFEKTSTQKNRFWSVKSGYALSILSYCMVTSSGNAAFPDEDAYTLPQYAYIAYPEYMHSKDEEYITTLELVEEDGDMVFVFPEFYDYGRVHFTPVWYPKGNYSMKECNSDCWTPSGMIYREFMLRTVKITDSVYDDWYEGRR